MKHMAKKLFLHVTLQKIPTVRNTFTLLIAKIFVNHKWSDKINMVWIYANDLN